MRGNNSLQMTWMRHALLMQRAELKKKRCDCCKQRLKQRGASKFTLFMSSITHRLDWWACWILQKVPLLQHLSQPSNILSILRTWLPFLKCFQPFLIKGSSYSLLLPSELWKCITSGNKADCNFIVQINRETASQQLQNLFMAQQKAIYRVLDIIAICQHWQIMFSNLQRIFFHWIVFSFLTGRSLCWAVLFLVFVL